MVNVAIFWINAVLAFICVVSFVIMQEVEDAYYNELLTNEIATK